MPGIVAPGELLLDRFRIVRFIAEGGMGEVYEADDQILGERVALKFLGRNRSDEESRQRFRREIQLARKVTHPNVCRLFDVFFFTPERTAAVAGEATFVTMELLAGESLAAHLAASGPLDEEECLPLARQMALGLAAAHEVGVVHRDFKPNNVMLVPDPRGAVPRVVITDFGLALSLAQEDTSRLTDDLQLVGTVDYIPPEQLRGEDVTTASDLYAFGVVLYEMLTGAKPYSAATLPALLLDRVERPPTDPCEYAPNLDSRWQEVVLRCLADKPEDRYESSIDVLYALGDSLENMAISSTAIRRPTAEELRIAPADDSTPPPGPPSPGRRKAGLAVTWTAIVAAVVLAALNLWPQRRQPPPIANLLNPTKLTTAPGLELDPAFSPDGEKLAFAADFDGSFEIYVVDTMAGSRPRRLTHEGGAKFEPAFSPDGEVVAYHDLAGGIWEIPVAGGQARRLAPFGSRPAFSPDGRTVVFQSESAPQLSDTAAPALAPSALWLVDRNGSKPRPLTRPHEPPGGHGSPSFSPDGQRIAFSASDRETSHLWMINIDGTQLIQLVEEPAKAYDPVWSPDGGHLYFSAKHQQVNRLWQLQISRQEGQPLTPPRQIANLGLASIRQLTVSKDGRRMAYAALATASDLYSLELDPATVEPASQHRLTSGTAWRHSRATFSLDGTRLAFDRWQLGVNHDIWWLDMNDDTSALRQATTHPGKDSLASWTRQADRLAFLGLREGQRQLWLHDLATGQENALIDFAPEVGWAKLSPDGERVAYHVADDSGVINIWVQDLLGEDSRQLTFDHELMGFPIWSLDGAWIAFQTKRGETSQVSLVPSTGGEPRILTGEAGKHWPYSFSPDADKIAFAAFRDGAWSLWWVSRNTLDQRRLTEPAPLNAYVRYPAWSPRGDRVVYERAETSGDIWLVDTAAAGS